MLKKRHSLPLNQHLTTVSAEVGSGKQDKTEGGAADIVTPVSKNTAEVDVPAPAPREPDKVCMKVIFVVAV